MTPVSLWGLILPIALCSSFPIQLSGGMDVHTPYMHTHIHTHTQAHSAKITESRRVPHLSLVIFSELCHRFVPGLCLEESSPTPRPGVSDVQARLPVTIAFCRQISCVLSQDAWIWVLVLQILPLFYKMKFSSLTSEVLPSPLRTYEISSLDLGLPWWLRW